MTLRETLDQVADTLPEPCLRQLVDFARFLSWEQETEEWRRFGRAQLARAYGPEEPDYSEKDLKRAGQP